MPKTGLQAPHVWICLAVIVAFQAAVYYGTRLILPYLPSYRFDTPLDAAIPLVPAFILVYILAFVSWGVSGLVILAQGREHAVRFTQAYCIGLVTAAVFFLVWPLTLDRPEITEHDLLSSLLRTVYASDQPNNLCPSLHVMASYFAWRGLWGCPKISRWFKGFNFVCLVLVSLSVVFVKQHLVIDIPGGLIVGEAALQAVKRMPIRVRS